MLRSFTKDFAYKTGLFLGVMILSGMFIYSHVHAITQPDAFIVEVQPSSFDTNQPVDLTVKAVTANGDVIKDYEGDVFIEIDGIVDTADYVVPSDGLYTFLPQDQGVKNFSKGLVIKKSGSFAVKVSDIINEAIQGEKTVIVGNVHNDTITENVTLISPVAGGIERNNVVNVLATATTLPNSPFEVYLNNTIVSQGTTDEMGSINAYISGVIAGDNQVQIKISNSNNEIIGESSTINFTYAPIRDGIFNSIQLLPSNRIKQHTKIEFSVSASDSVTSAQIKLSNNKSYPMDRRTAGEFYKQVLMDTEGTFTVGVELISAGIAKLYTGVATLIVDKSVRIGKIRIYSDSVDKTKLNVTREITGGTAPKFKVQYGTSSILLDQSVIVPTTEIMIDGLSIDETYYFQITPLDEAETIIGEPSEITQMTAGQDLSCVVKGIEIFDQKIGDKHYLAWTAVQNVDTYIIYRAEFETSDISQMQKVGETTGTMFEYPFNKLAKKDEYAFYTVEASCKDGTNLKIGNVQKVKVGPVENILLFIVISLFVYCVYRLYKYSND